MLPGQVKGELREEPLGATVTFRVGGVVVSPDGSHAAYGKFPTAPDQNRRLVLQDLASGQETEIASLGPWNPTRLNFSPDGTMLAAGIVSVSGDREELRIVRLPPANHNPIVVPLPPRSESSRPRGTSWSKLAWSPDSKWLPYLSSTGVADRFEVKLVEAATGQSRSLGGFVIEGSPDFQWSKDLTELAVHVTNADAALDVIRIVTLASQRVQDVPLPGPFQAGTRLQAWLATGDFVVRQTDPADPKVANVLLLSATAPRAKRICTTRAGEIMEDERPGRAQGGFADVGTDLCLGITRDGRSQIVWREATRRFFVHDLPTGQERPLTQGGGDELMGFLSPYSSRVAFAARRDGKWGTYLASVDEAPAQPELLEPIVGYPSTFVAWWHRNGLVTTVGSGDQHVYRAEITKELTGVKANGGLVQLTHATYDHTAPSVSPDNRRIAYWSEQGLAVMDADGSNERIIMRNPSNAARSHPPKWRSASEVLILTGFEPGASHFASVDVDSGKVTQRFGPIVGNATASLRHWDYSRIRDEIVYISPGPKAFVTTVYAYGLTAGVPRRLGDLETPEASVYSFLVSPDAGTIAYISHRGNCAPCEFGVVSTASWERKTLAQLADYPAIAAWAPDNRHVLFGASRPRVMDTWTGRSSDLLESSTGWDSHGWGSWSSDGAFVLYLVGGTSGSHGVKRWSIAAPGRVQDDQSPRTSAPAIATDAGMLLWTVPVEAFGQWGPLSTDGRYMAYGNADDGNVYLRDLASGTSRQVTDRQEVETPGAAAPGEVSEPGALSRDGRQLAYSWFVGTPTRAELRIVDVSGPGMGKPRSLVTDADIRWLQPRVWLPDGSAIVVGIWRRGGKEAQLALVSTVDGSVRLLKSVPWNGNDSTTLGTVAWSPDGKRIAFGPLTKDGTTRDVVVIDITTGAEVMTIAHPSSDNPVAWTPDGREVIITSDRGGAPGFWAATIAADGAGHVRYLGPAIDGYADYLGLTPSGSLVYYTTPATRWRARIASIDFNTGRVVAHATEAAPGYSKFNLFPGAWSPDGTRLAFVSDAEQPGDDHFVLIRDARTGQSTRVRPALAGFQNVVWSTDGQQFAVRGVREGAQCCAILRVDPQTGTVADVIPRADRLRAWLPDGRILFEQATDDGSGETALMEHDPARGTGRILHRWANGESGRLGMTLSLDGRMLYYRSPSSVAAPPHTLIAKELDTGKETPLLSGRPLGSIVTVAGGRFVLTSSEGTHLLVPTAGGAPTPIPQVRGVEPTILAWAGDGRSLLARVRGATSDAVTYWWLPLDGRTPRQLDLGAGPHAGGFLVRGSTVAFAERTGPASPPAEVRALEHFLPVRLGAQR